MLIFKFLNFYYLLYLLKLVIFNQAATDIENSITGLVPLPRAKDDDDHKGKINIRIYLFSFETINLQKLIFNYINKKYCYIIYIKI